MRRFGTRTAGQQPTRAAEEVCMHSIIYLVGLLVIIVALLNFVA